jgi:hypothetical protein
MRRLLKIILLVLLGVAITALAVANRAPVRFILDPLTDRDAALAVNAPLFIYLFIALLSGFLIGASLMWFKQGRWRKRAKVEHKEAVLWKREAENLKRGLQHASAAAAPRPLRTL